MVDRFPYLGDIVARNGGDAPAVEARVEAGSKAFGALRGCLFGSSSVSRAAPAKRAVYETVVLSIPFTAVSAGASLSVSSTSYACCTRSACDRCVESRVNTRGAITSRHRSSGSAAVELYYQPAGI